MTLYPAGTLLSPFGSALMVSSPSRQPYLRAVSVPASAVQPASQASTLKAAPATSRLAQMLFAITAFSTSTPVVTPSSTMPRSSVAGSYTKVWMVKRPSLSTVKLGSVPTF